MEELVRLVIWLQGNTGHGLEGHPTDTIDFDWKSLECRPAQKPAKAFSYKNARTTEQWKECGEELKLRLKENLQAKIAPAAKAYGMKKAGPKTQCL